MQEKVIKFYYLILNIGPISSNMIHPIYIISIRFSLLPPLFILGANGKVFSMSITKTKKVSQRCTLMLIFFSIESTIKIPNTILTVRPHTYYTCVHNNIWVAEKHQYAIIFHSLKALAYWGLSKVNRLLHFMLYVAVFTLKEWKKIV